MENFIFCAVTVKKYYFHFSTHKQLRKVKEVYQKIWTIISGLSFGEKKKNSGNKL